eukprot:TRINITY_DN2406_c0_g3_i1.p1 TRINITY_DN2406_c0_g3~~TRINITY_DN2406_c0_g3_i1.p1  ORF type:complete len:117 (+),score=21.30 TRINITY_DN2406_c0_g3_i1:90-440(+)
MNFAGKPGSSSASPSLNSSANSLSNSGGNALSTTNSLNTSNSSEKWTQLINIRPFMRSINCKFIVLEKGSLTKTKEGHVIQQYTVADQTGAVRLSLWDFHDDLLLPGDICRMTGGD